VPKKSVSKKPTSKKVRLKNPRKRIVPGKAIKKSFQINKKSKFSTWQQVLTNQSMRKVRTELLIKDRKRQVEEKYNLPLEKA
jgi:hypothetical protein